jgi:thioredoxin 1
MPIGEILEGNIINVSSIDFDEKVVNNNNAVLVDFWAEWCGPCKMIAPVLEAVAADRNDLVIAKVNIDENQDLAVKYAIRSIPSLLFFKDGKVAGQKLGACSKSELEAFIASSI